jgi:hypothetical protein
VSLETLAEGHVSLTRKRASVAHLKRARRPFDASVDPTEAG